MLVVACTLALVSPARAGVTTNNQGNMRVGWYSNQPGLAPAAVTNSSFGALFTTAVDGQVYAQPLVSGDTLVVATEKNNVYGLAAATGAPRWTRNLGVPWTNDIGCPDLLPTIGVTSTPVIDPATHTVYVVNKTYASGTSGPAAWWMHAMDVATGAERTGFPVAIAGTAQNAPSRTFAPTNELQRPGLLLNNGVVYAAFGSLCDISPFAGWIFGITTGGTLRTRWSAMTSSSDGAGIWQSGSGIMSDAPGRLFVATGNPGFVLTAPTAGSKPPADLGIAVVRLAVQSDGRLQAKDFFSPRNAPDASTRNIDLGAGGPVGLPNAYFGTAQFPHLMFVQGKDGYAYLLNRDNLGGYRQGVGGGDAVVTRIGPFGGVWGKAGVWPGDGGYLYVVTSNPTGGTDRVSSGNLLVYKYGLGTNGRPTITLAATSGDPFPFGSGSPVVTSNGTTSGTALVWTIWRSPQPNTTPAELRAYDPVPVDGQPVLRWSVPIGIATKFSVPTIDANRVYVATNNGFVTAYGACGGASQPQCTLDDSPPTTTIIYPSGGATLSANSLLDASASDNVGVTAIEFHATDAALNDTVLGAATRTNYGWIFTWDTSTATNGSYTLTSVAHDAAGNTTTSSPISVAVQN
jgi:iron transport multicopper oxidase